VRWQTASRTLGSSGSVKTTTGRFFCTASNCVSNDS
jgi:hypothetical protein